MSLSSHRDDGSAPVRTTTVPVRPSIGLAALLELFDRDDVAVASLLAAAIASIESDQKAIHGAAQTDDRRAIVEAAHRIKGTSGSIGAPALIEISARIEMGAARTGAGIAPGLLDDLQSAVETVRAEIDAYTIRAH